MFLLKYVFSLSRVVYYRLQSQEDHLAKPVRLEEVVVLIEHCNFEFILAYSRLDTEEFFYEANVFFFIDISACLFDSFLVIEW